MTRGRKAKVSVTLDRDLLAVIDRQVKAGATRSQVIEQWLRVSALAQARRELDAATVAYYEGRSAEQRAEDERLASFSASAVGELDLDRTPRTRRRRAR
jgi:metal-responsive CopG/Arc/MetJ family transcriptional regulator